MEAEARGAMTQGTHEHESEALVELSAESILVKHVAKRVAKMVVIWEVMMVAKA